MSVIGIIGCIVGIIGCVIGVATFVSAQLTKAKQDGMLIAKIDQCVQGIEELKKDVKEKNLEVNRILTEHSIKIAEFETRIKQIEQRE